MQLSKEKILQTFDIESHESSMVMLLLLQSVFLGIFFGAFDTAANSLFLSVFPANDLPGAFTISGIAGILMTSLYSFLQSRINFNKLAAYNIAAVAVITFIMWFGFKLTTSKWHVFLVLVMMGPLNIIAMLGFWGTAGRIFTLRQGKRLFGLVDAGQIIGVILSSYAIPIILSFHIKTNDILFISTISALVALVFQFVISFRTDKLSVKTVVSKSIEKEHSLKNLMKNKFIRLMAIFVALSMVAAFFVSFSFLAVTKLKYPDETGLAKFFGVFTGTVMFFTLIIKTFVYGKFMKTYGLQMALIISPVLLALLSLVAMLTGMFGGYIASSSGFVFFFLLIAISRLFSVALKSSIEAPSFKILYQTISSSIRYHVQARVDGTINEISALASGLILLGIGLLSFVSLIHYTEVLLVLLIFWIYIAYSLYKAYKKNLDDSLVQIKSDVDNSQQKSRIGIVSKVLQGNEQASRIKFVMNLQEKLQPIVYESLIPYLINHRLDDIKVYALEKSKSLKVFEAIEPMKNIHDEKFFAQTQLITKQLTADLLEGIESERIITLSRSKIVQDRELAARLIKESGQATHIQTIKYLLRDFDQNVKSSAIKAAARIKSKELAPVLSEFLLSDTYGPYAFDALIATGEDALESLEHLFSKSLGEKILLLRILKILGSIGTPKALESLVSKVTYHDSEVAQLAASLLLQNNFSANEDQYTHIHSALVHYLSITAWNIAARASLAEYKEHSELQHAISDEIRNGFEHIFTLLALAHDTQSVLHIKQNVLSDNNESTDYAIELLELMIADDLKPLLFPIIDDASDNEKIKQLQENFPIEKMSLLQLLLDIVNRDYNYISIWTKTCALHTLLSFEKLDITNDIIAQLFNPHEMLSELGACIVFKSKPDILPFYYKRLNEKTRVRLKNAIDQFEAGNSRILYDKVHFLKSIPELSNISGSILYRLASNLRIKTFEPEEEIESIDDDLEIVCYLLVSGNVRVTQPSGAEIEIGSGEFFSGIFAPGYPVNFPSYQSVNESTVYCLHQEAFDKILFDNLTLAESLVNIDSKHIYDETNI